MNTQIAPPIKPCDDRYLSFYLNQQTPALLLMEYAQEVIIVPKTRLSPMPNMPECVLGLLNRRSKILWVVNLAQMLNLPGTEPIAQQYQIVIIQVKQVKLGLVVQSVKGVTYFANHCRQTPTKLYTGLAPYVSECITQGDEILIVLDVEKITNSPNLKT
ncbi:chemotaxis protein CheW [Synechocystis sp. PCC 7509]|uniref:chemotaxis protein CheW n=1 Tax=Synechocystis sp. PCC 7509 TaxID=927677 RepID=UPI0002AD1173|nr:chemotaxis protein CheW [Synechocystis sp. PCC 7509]